MVGFDRRARREGPRKGPSWMFGAKPLMGLPLMRPGAASISGSPANDRRRGVLPQAGFPNTADVPLHEVPPPSSPGLRLKDIHP